MGYTHYWEFQKNFTQKDWKELKQAARQIFEYCQEIEVPLALESNQTDMYPVVDDEEIRFNGHGEYGHDTFVLNRVKPKLEFWMLTKNPFVFCKTARKPYDLAVCLVLLSAFMIAPDVLVISSDGEWDGDWNQARQDYIDLFGEEPVCPFPYMEPQGDVPPFHHFINQRKLDESN